MSKIVTIRMDEDKYNFFKSLALQENRALSNFIETAALKYIEEHQYVDDFEMDEILSNDPLNKNIKKGMTDYKAGRGNFV